MSEIKIISFKESKMINQAMRECPFGGFEAAIESYMDGRSVCEGCGEIAITRIDDEGSISNVSKVCGQFRNNIEQ